MKKMDEMERNIYLRSIEWGYKAVLLVLCVWTGIQCWQTLVNKMVYYPFPGFLLCFGVCVQGFAQMVIKRKKTAGDEEYREPNKLIWMIAAVIVIVIAVLSLGTWVLIRL